MFGGADRALHSFFYWWAALHQPQRLEAGHTLAADHQVVVHRDLQRTRGLDDLLHVSRRTRRKPNRAMRARSYWPVRRRTVCMTPNMSVPKTNIKPYVMSEPVSYLYHV